MDRKLVLDLSEWVNRRAGDAPKGERDAKGIHLGLVGRRSGRRGVQCCRVRGHGGGGRALERQLLERLVDLGLERNHDRNQRRRDQGDRRAGSRGEPGRRVRLVPLDGPDQRRGDGHDRGVGLRHPARRLYGVERRLADGGRVERRRELPDRLDERRHVHRGPGHDLPDRRRRLRRPGVRSSHRQRHAQLEPVRVQRTRERQLRERADDQRLQRQHERLERRRHEGVGRA